MTTRTYRGPFPNVTVSLPTRRIRAQRGEVIEFTPDEVDLLDPTCWSSEVADPGDGITKDPIEVAPDGTTVDLDPEPVHLGGGWYRTADGHTTRGRPDPEFTPTLDTEEA